MEPLSVVAGITSTVAGALCVIKGLHSFICTINGGPADILSLSKDVSTLGDILQALQSCISLGLVRQNAVDALEPSLLNCTQAAEELEEILRPFTKQVHATYLRWTSSFKWAFKKSDVKDCVDRLTVSKQTLTITLGIINTYAVENGKEEIKEELLARTTSIRANLAMISADLKNRATNVRRSDSQNSSKGSLFNGTDSGLPLRRFLEEAIPNDHPWTGATNINEIISVDALSLVTRSRPASLLTINPDTFKSSGRKIKTMDCSKPYCAATYVQSWN